MQFVVFNVVVRVFFEGWPFRFDYLYFSSPISCGFWVMGSCGYTSWQFCPIGSCEFIIALGAEGISWMNEVCCLVLLFGWSTSIMRCSCSIFLLISLLFSFAPTLSQKPVRLNPPEDTNPARNRFWLKETYQMSLRCANPRSSISLPRLRQ